MNFVHRLGPHTRRETLRTPPSAPTPCLCVHSKRFHAKSCQESKVLGAQSVFLIKELNARAARKVTGLEQNIKVEWVYLRVRITY